MATLHKFKNNCIGLTQNNPLAPVGTNLIVDNALDAKLLSLGFNFWLTLWHVATTPDTDSLMEIVEVTARVSPNNYTIVRAQQGTTAQTFAMESNVALLWTSGNAAEVLDTVDPVAKGTMIYYGSDFLPRLLPIGSEGQGLIVASGIPAWQDTPILLEYFGDASDGSIDINSGSFSSGPITNNQLTRDAYFDVLTLSGGNLDTNGYKVFAHSIVLDSTFKIFISVNAGGNGGNGGHGSGTRGTGGTGASAGNTGTVYGGMAGVAGGNGGDGLSFSAAPGNTGSTGTNGAVNNISLVNVAGVAGVNGGNSGTGGPGAGTGGTGASGGSTATVTNYGAPHTQFQLARFLDPTTATWTLLNLYKTASSSGGSAGGGSAGGGSSSISASGGGGGGSGGNAGVVYISAYAIINNGTIQSKGGIGGNGGTGATGADSTSTGGGGGGGAGSGGQGGLIVLIYHSLTGSGSTDVTGGSGGIVGSGGVGFSGGATNGHDGSAGNTGNSGVVLSYAV